MADLKTNYVDDVLDTSVNVKRKYNMIQNVDGTVSFDDVTTYTQNGDSFGAKDINDTNTAVNELNSNLTDTKNSILWKNSNISFSYPTTANISGIVAKSNELYVIGTFGNDSMIVIIPTTLLTDNIHCFDVGFGYNNSDYLMSILCTKTNMQLFRFIYGGVERNAEATVQILYR